MSVEDMSKWRKVLRACEEEDAKEERPTLDIEEWKELAGDLTAALHNMMAMFAKTADLEKFPNDLEISELWIEKMKEAELTVERATKIIGKENFEEQETE